MPKKDIEKLLCPSCLHSPVSKGVDISHWILYVTTAIYSGKEQVFYIYLYCNQCPPYNVKKCINYGLNVYRYIPISSLNAECLIALYENWTSRQLKAINTEIIETLAHVLDIDLPISIRSHSI